MPGQGRPQFCCRCLRAASRILLVVTALLWLTKGTLAAEPGASSPTTAAKQTATSHEPTPLQDDATLHDVVFVGSDNGWVVGDRGVVWRTTDGGQTWRLLPTPVNCALTSACFLSDRVGWVVGGGIVPFTRTGYGVVLYTTDGGESWKQVTGAPLPQLEYVRFFTLHDGVVVGASDPTHPAGILETHDGGQTWSNVEGPRQEGFRAAHFLRPGVGVAAGMRGSVVQVDGNVVPQRTGRIGLQNLHDVTLNRDDTGWLVGDGGLALQTTNRGVVWQEPATPLPVDLRNIVDFRTVANRGEKVWLAGEPGSVVWHSPDGGRSWARQFTGQTAPLSKLCFTSDTAGYGVGTFGTIVRTVDGGQTWQKIRGGDRRAALLALHAHPQRISFPLLVNHAGDLGYRSVVLLPARGDIGPEGVGEQDVDLQLDAAVVAAGGSAGEFGWQLPVGLPDLAHDAERLLAEWNRATEGKLQEVLLGKIVCQLRTWKPEVVVLDEPPPDDATTRLLNEAVLAAVTRAADSTWHIAQNELAGLQTWQVKRVYLRVAPGSSGQTVVDAYKYLPRLGVTVQQGAAPAAARLLPQSTIGTEPREEFRLVYDFNNPDNPAGTGHDFFAGLPLLPGSEARRQLNLDDGERDELAERMARRQRDFQATVAKSLDDPRLSAQIIGQLRETTQGMPGDLAALQLAQLAGSYRRKSQWDHEEATLIELVNRFPREPAAVDAMRRLFLMWSGAEFVWQRLRTTEVERSSLQTNTTAMFQTIENVHALLRVDPALREVTTLDGGPDPLQLVSHAEELELSNGRDMRENLQRFWQDQALKMASIIRKQTPALYTTPEIQFPLAALSRQRGMAAPAQGFLANYHQQNSDDPWSLTAATEISLSRAVNEQTKRVIKCHPSGLPPMLDSVLSDDCWQMAQEVRLTESGTAGETGESALVFLSYDTEHLYIAATVPRVAGIQYDGPQPAGRVHDADLLGHDRLVISLDIDRDYATWYTIEIDERGWVREQCWDDPAWNPQMWVDTKTDGQHWRIEAAIPFAELAARAPRKNESWGIGIVRVVPAVGVQGWTQPASSQPRPDAFGLIRFE